MKSDTEQDIDLENLAIELPKLPENRSFLATWLKIATIISTLQIPINVLQILNGDNSIDERILDIKFSIVYLFGTCVGLSAIKSIERDKLKNGSSIRIT